jgi:hypothetical protein
MEEGKGFCDARSGISEFFGILFHASESISEGSLKGQKREPGYDFAGRFKRISSV